MGMNLRPPSPVGRERGGVRAAAWFAVSLRAALYSMATALLSGCGPDTPDQPPAAQSPAAPAKTPGAPTETTAPKTGSTASTEMVLIRGGTFTMGDKDEVDAPPHEVVVAPFYMDKLLVTQAKYRELMNANPSRWKGDDNPVEQLRWSEAARFCNLRSEKEGLHPCYDPKTWTCNFDADGYRLPSEAEWEFACRAGTTTTYFFGDSPTALGDYAWFDRNSGGHPRPVGRKQPNPWGLYDICGNVWEWCNDFYKVDYYGESPRDNPRGPKTGENKVVRGGAWRFGPESCKSGYRYNENPGSADVCFGYDIYGFRCVRNAPSLATRYRHRHPG